MKVFYSDRFELPLPRGHRFPMAKYRLLRIAVEESGLFSPSSLRVPAAATDEELLRVHTPAYVEGISRGTLDRQAMRRIGFPWSPELVERSRRSVGATLGAARSALDGGCGVNLAGGTHHAFADRGGGFCVFNDVAVGIRTLQAAGAIGRAVVIDCDVHQGDGTAAIFAGDPTVFTLSIHGRGNYPFRKQTSDLDVELDDGTGDAGYLRALDGALEALGGRERFDLAAFVAGADPYEGDRLGRLSLTAAGLAERDRRVLRWCRRRDLPTVVVMGGGYADNESEIAALHLATVRAAHREWCSTIPPEAGAAIQL